MYISTTTHSPKPVLQSQGQGGAARATSETKTERAPQSTGEPFKQNPRACALGRLLRLEISFSNCQSDPHTAAGVSAIPSLAPRRARENRGETPQRPATAKKTMGKKSRRQRESGGAATGFLKPHKRFEPDHWRHKDGSSVTNEETKRLYLGMRFSGPGLMKGYFCSQGEFKHEFMSLVVARRLAAKGSDSAIEAWKRWPEWKPHWSRIRRRICDHCGRRVSLSEPRFMVCGGCGVARYCSEACQTANWGHHQTVCAALVRHAARGGKAASRDRSASG